MVYCSAKDVANWFLSKEAMSHKKLQKLSYYAYAWTLTLLNDSIDNIENKLFAERIEAWVHGAVVKDLYTKYAEWGWDDIPQNHNYKAVKGLESTGVREILEQVWSEYGKYTADELESINHQETPWINARKGLLPYQSCSVQISDTDIFKYYNEV